MSDDETFITRWSRRKAAARDSSPTDDPPRPATHAVDSAPPRGEGNSIAQDARAAIDVRPAPLTDADFGDVDFGALDYQSDYGRFMQADVPDAIRRKALHRLWESDPIFTQVDPFQDYAGDYTDKAVGVPMGALKTAYKIGQGFLTDDEAAVWDRLGKPEVATAAAVAPLTIEPESPLRPEIAGFFAASEAYMAALYPAASNHFVGAEALAVAHATFLVARRDGRAIGCGAVVDAGDASGEIKRMWIEPAARGMGAGRRLLAALEAAAVARGIAILRLETGAAQPAALGLYRAAGFTERGPFGSYQSDPLSVFMEKRLAGP